MMDNNINSLINEQNCNQEIKDVILKVIEIIAKYPSQTHHPDTKAIDEIVKYLNELEDE